MHFSYAILSFVERHAPHRQDELITPSPLVAVVFALTMSEQVLHQRLLGALLFDCETERK
jgi:hypothetical protein